MKPYLQDSDFTDCVEWHLRPRSDGYGQTNRNQWPKPRLAHRHVWEECFGPLADDEHLHHVCGNKMCVNPAHLQVLRPEDHQPVHAATRTHCRRGHSYAEHGRFHSGTSARYCKECERLGWHRRKNAAVFV